MRVRYTPRAFADREAIFDYLQQRSPRGARNVKHAIVRAILLLASHPRIAPLTDVPGVHEVTVPRRPYKVYYRIEVRKYGSSISAMRDESPRKAGADKLPALSKTSSFDRNTAGHPSTEYRQIPFEGWPVDR
jgi:toxin ParE1/3/4